ncbi:MAG: DUF3106 domain-containing protein [Nitrospirae bacterium]|nr:DUF3106 domain-containing protein [Nitrospirota bacterium]
MENVSGNAYEENLRRWQGLSEQERQAIRERASRLGTGQMQKLREESERFKGMPKEEQDKIRGNYQEFNKLPPREREVLRERYKRFESLPPEKREELRRQFRERRDTHPGGPGNDPGMSGAPPVRGPEPHRERESLPGRERSPNFKEDNHDRKKDIIDHRKDIQGHREDIRNRHENRRDHGTVPDRQGRPSIGAGPSRGSTRDMNNNPPVPHDVPGTGMENRPRPGEGPEKRPDRRPEFRERGTQGHGGGPGSGGRYPGSSPRDRYKR